MTTRNRVRAALHFTDGTVIDTFQTFDWRDTVTDPLGSITLETRPIRSNFAFYRELLSKGELVTLLINDVSQGGFLIQDSDRVYGPRGMSIKVTCHSVLVTPFEGDVDPDLSLTSPTDISVEETILKVLGPYGFHAIVSDPRAHASAISGKPIGGGKTSLLVSDLKQKDTIAHAGETAYQFCARVFTRLGVCLRVQYDGTLLIGAPDYSGAPVATVVMSTKPGTQGDYFVGDVHVHESNAHQFSECNVRGMRAVQLGEPNAARPSATVKAVDVLPARSAYRSTVAPYKPKTFEDKSSRDPDRAESVAQFELGMHAKDAFWVEGEVDGWISSTGVIWTVDTMVRVVIEPEGIDEPMYVLERTFTESDRDGQKTKLKLIPSGALILGKIPKGKK